MVESFIADPELDDDATQGAIYEVISKFDSFMRGFDDIKALNLPPLLGRTSEAIGEDLTEMGFDPKSEADSELKKKVLGASEIVGQVGTPGVGLIPLVKGGKKIVETVKNSSKTNNNIGSMLNEDQRLLNNLKNIL